MSKDPTRRSAAALAVLLALVHFFEAPEYLEEKAYVGVLFIVGGVGLVVAAVLLLRAGASALLSSATGWLLAVLISAGMFLGGILSRTTGLPGFSDNEWDIALIISLVLEVGVFVCWLMRSSRARTLLPDLR